MDGNNAALDQTNAGQINYTGPKIIDADYGIYGSAVNNLNAQYNIVQNVNWGVLAYNPSDTSVPTSGAMIASNLVTNCVDAGVTIGHDAYGTVTGNTIVEPDGGNAGIWIYDFTRSGSTSATQTVTVSNNNVAVGAYNYAAIWANLFHPSTTATLAISGNTLNGASDVATGWPVFGIYVTSSDSSSVTIPISNNTIGQSAETLGAGIDVWNAPGAAVSVSGGSIANATVGIDLENVDVYFGNGDTTSTSLSVSNVSISGVTTGIRVGDVPSTYPGAPLTSWGGTNNVAGSVVLNLSGGSITGATTAIQVQGQSSGAYTATLNLQGGTTVTDGATGLDIDGAKALLAGNTLSSTVFSGQSGNYITLADGALFGHVVNATGASFERGRRSALFDRQLAHGLRRRGQDDRRPGRRQPGLRAAPDWRGLRHAHQRRRRHPARRQRGRRPQHRQRRERHLPGVGRCLSRAMTIVGDSQSGVQIGPAAADAHADGTSLAQPAALSSPPAM